MGLTPLRTHRLPLPRPGHRHRRLAQTGSAHDQGRRLRRMVPPLGPHHPRLRPGDTEPPALEKIRYGHGALRGHWAVALGCLRAGTAGAGDPHTVPGHEARVLARATPQRPAQICLLPAPGR
jgi:hypothetical protein